MAALNPVLPARAARQRLAAPSPAPPPQDTDAPPKAALPKNGLAFALYLTLVGLEYSGVTGQYAILKILHVPTLVLFLTTALVLKQYGTTVFTEYRETRLIAMWTAMTFLSVVWAVVRLYVVEAMSAAFGNLIFCVAGAYLIDRRSRLMAVAWLLAVVQARLVLTNLDILSTGERIASFRGPYFASDGNEYAWTLNMMGPMVLLLFTEGRQVIVKMASLAVFGLGLFAIVGTQSRGATLAVVPAGLIYLLFVAKRKALGVVAIVVLAAGALAAAPGAYFSRMGTITHAEDSSATLRLQAWNAAMKMAIDFPLGAGADNFNSAYGRYYIPDNSPGYAGRRWVNTHSVYFKVLGEFGYLGLGLYLTAIFTMLRSCYQLRKRIRADPTRYECPESMPGLVMMSLVAWAINGAFLSGYVYPHMFFVLAVGVGSMRMCGFYPTANQPALRSATEGPARPAGRTAAVAVTPVAGARPLR